MKLNQTAVFCYIIDLFKVFELKKIVDEKLAVLDEVEVEAAQTLLENLDAIDNGTRSCPFNWPYSIDLYRPKCTTDHRHNLKINYLVLLVDGDVPRGNWPSAVLQQVFPSTDGVLRRVNLRKITTGYFDNFG